MSDLNKPLDGAISAELREKVLDWQSKVDATIAFSMMKIAGEVARDVSKQDPSNREVYMQRAASFQPTKGKIIEQELCDPTRSDAVKVSLVQMADGHIEWVKDVREDDKVLRTIITTRPPLMVR